MTGKVVIVGGGTAGWITACLLAATHRKPGDRKPEIVLIESPDIPTIGVGEGTWPSMRMTLQKVGISEAELIRECDASFKQGTEFIGWSEDGDQHRYYHPFSLPIEYASLNLANYWLAGDSQVPFADFVTPQARVIAAGLAPKQTTTPQYAFNVNYGYHFDAAKFARLLHRHAVEVLGVRYLSANVDAIESRADGDVAAVVLSSREKVDGDLFVDCTGQRSLLLGQHFGVEIESVRQFLFNDAAIAVQVPYENATDAIAPVTRATAMEAGWTWDIGLQNRRGLGYVYSSAHTDEARALAMLEEYIHRTTPGVRIDNLAFRSIPFEPGYRREFWVRNCVAVGLAGGFIEPLEASALALIEQAATIISQQFPADRQIMSVVARRFNDKMEYHWKRVIEFLKLHYVLSRRTTGTYWNDCRAASSCPDSLTDKLTLWQQQPPWHDDAPRIDELFPSASYQYVLYGMGFRPRYAAVSDVGPGWTGERIDKLLHDKNETARQMLRLLPTNRELVTVVTSLRGVA